MNSSRVAACALRNEQAVRAHRPGRPVDMLLSAVSVLVVAQSSSEIPEGLMNNPVYKKIILISFFTISAADTVLS